MAQSAMQACGTFAHSVIAHSHCSYRETNELNEASKSNRILDLTQAYYAAVGPNSVTVTEDVTLHMFESNVLVTRRCHMFEFLPKKCQLPSGF